MDRKIEAILKKVSKPGRYIGGEFGEVLKDKSRMNCRWVFCFPDTYEIGMSNLGMPILCGVLNKEEDIWCERCYAPWPDMAEEMQKAELPLWALESGDPLRNFDIVAFTLQYEQCYTMFCICWSLPEFPLWLRIGERIFPFSSAVVLPPTMPSPWRIFSMCSPSEKGRSHCRNSPVST